MNILDCTRIDEAPEKGWMLVYARLEVIFEPYDSWEIVKERLKEMELLEVHLFDEKKEYRCLESRSPRFDDKKIETIADFPEDENVYKEIVLLEKPWEMRKLMILNHICYGDDSEVDVMGHIDNYRLVMLEPSEVSGKEEKCPNICL